MKSVFRRLVRSRWLQLLLGSAISIWAMYLAVEEISLPEVKQVLSHAKWLYLVPALIAVAVHHGVKALRWRLLLSPIQVENRSSVRLQDLFLALMAGQMLNLVYPARIGDLSRIWLIGNRGPGKAATAGTLVFEKLIDTFWYAVLMLALAALITLPEWTAGGVWIIVMILLGFWLLIILTGNDPILNTLTARLKQHWRAGWIPIEQVKQGIRSFRNGIAGGNQLLGWRPLGMITIWSATAWGMSLLVNWLISMSLGIHFDNALETLAAQLLVLVGLQAGIAVPSLPGRVGVFEYICILALGVFHIRSADAFSYGVLLHIVVMLPTMLAGWAALVIFGLDRKQVLDELAADQLG